MMGIGGPQYRWREMSQSRKRYCVSNFPPANSAIFFLAFSESMPSNFPEFTNSPSPSQHSETIFTSGTACPGIGSGTMRGGSMTFRIGSLYFFAKSKSRASCAGTAMMAPVPYPEST